MIYVKLYLYLYIYMLDNIHKFTIIFYATNSVEVSKYSVVSKNSV